MPPVSTSMPASIGRHTGMAVGRPIGTCNTIQEFDRSIGAPSDNPIDEGAWVSYIGVFDNGKVSIYLNGKLAGSKDLGYYSSLNCSNAQLTLGAWWKSYMNNFYGAMDELRIHNRALSPCEITYLRI
ncbi:MAG: LamG domain-containing protein [Flavihumibacter sp.]